MSLGEVSLVISMAGAVPYCVQVVRGSVRPERMTWFVWTLILALALASYYSSGASDSVWFLVGDFIVTAAVFLLSLWRGQGGWTRLDGVCSAVAGVSLLVWQLSAVSWFGLCGVLVADAVALVPTLVKSLHDPASESVSTYAFSSVAALCGFVAVGEWNMVLLFYPAYLFLANFTTAMVVWVGQYHLNRTAESVNNQNGPV
ncbi:MAG TPA: hypothetical protein VLH86_03430 [Patescibacteria group bacterium]|nr:hypothetical protein [Patescibacteria group bacterium]